MIQSQQIHIHRKLVILQQVSSLASRVTGPRRQSLTCRHLCATDTTSDMHIRRFLCLIDSFNIFIGLEELQGDNSDGVKTMIRMLESFFHTDARDHSLPVKLHSEDVSLSWRSH